MDAFGVRAIHLRPKATELFAHFGKAVRACRTEAGLTVEEAALTIGLAKQTLSDLEAGSQQ